MKKSIDLKKKATGIITTTTLVAGSVLGAYATTPSADVIAQMDGLKADMSTMIAAGGAAGLALAGIYMVWKNGIGIFKGLVKK